MTVFGKINEKNKRAFTVSEALITLSLLGVIAAVLVPTVVSRHRQIETKVKIRKAMSEYDSFLRRIYAQNALTMRTNAQLKDAVMGTPTINCQSVYDNMTTIRRQNDGCKFMTSDNIWWQITATGNNLWTAVAATEADLDTIVRANQHGQSYGNGAWMFSAFDNEGRLYINDVQAAERLNRNQSCNGSNATPCQANRNLQNFIDP